MNHGRGEGMAVLRRRRGRPPLVSGEATVPATVNLPASVYDRLARRAVRENLDLSKLLRRALTEYSNEKSTGIGGVVHPDVIQAHG